MKISIATIFVSLFLFAVSCGTPQGKPTDLGNACAPENEKQYLEVSGYIVPRSAVFCSNIGGGRLECGFDFSDSAGGEKKMSAEIEQGSGANTVDKLPSGYKKEDIKIRDNGGNPIALTDKVKVTGKMSIAPAAPGGQGVCFMQVEKIEGAK
jgi:hypothetical protein